MSTEKSSAGVDLALPPPSVESAAEHAASPSAVVEVTPTEEANNTPESVELDTENEHSKEQEHRTDTATTLNEPSPVNPQESDNKESGEDLIESQPDNAADETTPLVTEPAPVPTADETTPLVGAQAAATEDDDDETTPEGDAPPLPEKRPLPSSREDLAVSVTYEDSDHGDTSSESSHDGQPEVVDETPVVIAQPTVVSTEQNAPPIQTLPVDVAVGIPCSPNEPPPPYPGAPSGTRSGDPYDGAPGDDRTDDRVVIVQRAGVVGNCPKCQTGNVMKNFSFCGICLAIWLFPCGLICLFCMREKKCSHCNQKV